MKSNQVSKVVARLSEMLQSHFGVEVEYIPVVHGGPASITAPAPATSRALETAKRNAGAPMIVAHNHMIIPMRVDGSLVGATNIARINKLHPRQLSQIKDTVDLILNEVLAAAKKIEHFQSVENFLNKEKSNVISLVGRRPTAVAVRN